MSSTQRSIRRIQPACEEPWENQFWPVALALLATVGLAIGAATALLRGPWLWASLVTLPILAAVALGALLRMRNRWLRRSMQLGVVVSLAAHCLALLLSAIIEIFGGPVARPMIERSPPRPQPTLIVSQRDPQPIWEQIEVRQAPDPVVESMREAVSAESTQPLPTSNLPQNQPSPTEQPIARRTPTASVARQDVSLSERKRSEAHQPTVAVNTASEPTRALAATAPQISETRNRDRRAENDSSRESRATEVARLDPPTTPHVSSSRREQTVELVTPTPDQTSAPARSAQTVLPQTAVATSTRQQPHSTPTESTVVRQAQELPNLRTPAAADARQVPDGQPQQRQLSPDSLAVRLPTRADSPALPPTWSQSPATVQTPRSTAIPSETMASPTARENPQTASAETQPTPSRAVAATSSTRGQSGGVSAELFRNAQPVANPSAGLAAAPSDATSRRRSEHRVDPQPMLTSIEQPQSSGRQTGSQMPQSAWQANVLQPAPLSARAEPAPVTSEAAAANRDSVAQRSAPERASEQGTSELDIGQTKLTADTTAQRHSGGGHPAPAMFDAQLPQLAARSAAGSHAMQPTPEVGLTPSGPMAASASASAHETQPSARESAPRSAGGDQPRTNHTAASDPSEATGGPDFGSSALGEGAARRRADEQPLKGIEGLTASSDSQPLGSRQPNRTARAPQADSISATASAAPSSQSSAGNKSAGPSERTLADARSPGADAAVRQGSIRLDLPAEPGPAGLADDPRPGPGTMLRPAARDVTEAVVESDSRFRRRDAGAVPQSATDANIASDAFRDRRQRTPATGPTTEAAIELGLEFLARYQRSDGSWSLLDFDRHDPRHGQILSSDMAATGLAILAFQGAGYTHRDYKYAQQLSRAMEWMLQNQSRDGMLFVSDRDLPDDPRRMYSHAIATLALTEAYGMTQDPKLREPIDRALRFISTTQDAKHGGWRYYSDPTGRRTDTSVTGWMMMALQSARLADVHVEDKVWLGIEQWLDSARDPNNESQFRYDPYADASQLQHRAATPSMTSVGLLMRLYLGWDRRDQRLIDGGAILLRHLPSNRSPLERDTYYWYYATQVLRHLGGETWDQWNRHLHPLLVDSQIKSGELAGSWDPYSPVPDRWAHAGGRLYVTTMNLLSLEVNHRLLPLYSH